MKMGRNRIETLRTRKSNITGYIRNSFYIAHFGVLQSTLTPISRIHETHPARIEHPVVSRIQGLRRTSAAYAYSRLYIIYPRAYLGLVSRIHCDLHIPRIAEGKYFEP